MNTEQFINLTGAYGADIKRWPEAHQQQAAKVIALNLAEVNLALEQARALDEIFASHKITPSERALFENIVASAPKQNNASFWQRLRINGWIGISSIVGTGLAGAVAGALFVSIWTSSMLSANVDGTGESASSMAQYVDVGQEWS